MYILYYKWWLIKQNHCFKYLYDKIYTNGYYSGFYSSLREKFEEMVVILNFLQRMDKNDNIHHVFIQSNCKSWLANVQHTQLDFQKAIQVLRSIIYLFLPYTMILIFFWYIECSDHLLIMI
jgi:hypothetical protein